MQKKNNKTKQRTPECFFNINFQKRKKENKNQEDMRIFLKRTLGQHLDFSTNCLLITHD